MNPKKLAYLCNYSAIIRNHLHLPTAKFTCDERDMCNRSGLPIGLQSDDWSKWFVDSIRCLRVYPNRSSYRVDNNQHFKMSNIWRFPHTYIIHTYHQLTWCSATLDLSLCNLESSRSLLFLVHLGIKNTHSRLAKIIISEVFRCRRHKYFENLFLLLRLQDLSLSIRKNKRHRIKWPASKY